MNTKNKEKIKSQKIKGKVKVILLSKIRGLGTKGTVADVANGYYRNYLKHQNTVKLFSDENLKIVLSELNQGKNKVENTKDFDILNDKFLLFAQEASGTDSLYGAIRNRDIADEIKKLYSIEVDYRRITIDRPIKKLGIYKITIDLSGDVSVTMNAVVARSIEDAKKMVEN